MTPIRARLVARVAVKSLRERLAAAQQQLSDLQSEAVLPGRCTPLGARSTGRRQGQGGPAEPRGSRFLIPVRLQHEREVPSSRRWLSGTYSFVAHKVRMAAWFVRHSACGIKLTGML